MRRTMAGLRPGLWHFRPFSISSCLSNSKSPRLCAFLTAIVQCLVGPAQRCSRRSPSCAHGFLHDVLDRPPFTYRQFYRRPLSSD